MRLQRAAVGFKVRVRYFRNTATVGAAVEPSTQTDPLFIYV